MPELLALSDIVILPNRPTLFARAQVPGKIFEALTMGKVVIGSDISDIPKILEKSVIVIKHNKMEDELESVLNNLIEHPYLFE
jgi:glycosyltransferase involved in cell wall biosynthesis